MNENIGTVMGKMVRDRITGKEGIAVMVFHWITGCDTVMYEDREGKGRSAELPRLEILQEGGIEGIVGNESRQDDEYLENLGKKGRDRITGFEGVVVGLCTHAFRASQYCLQPMVSDGRIGGIEIIDCQRVDFSDDELSVDPESVQDRTGGGFDLPKKRSFI